MKIYESYGYSKYRDGCGTLRASGGDVGPGSEMLCVGRAREWNRGVSPTLTGDHQNRVTDYTAIGVYPNKTGPLMANSHPESYTGQDAFSDMLPVVPSDILPRKYIVRRLTPLECCRLQGFPDWWVDGCEEYPVQGWWTKNDEWRRWIDPSGAVAGSDGAKYRMWGNGMALPNMLFVIAGIAAREDS